MPVLFKTDIPSDADLKVFVTDIRPEAHLVIFETSNAWEAAESTLWFFTDIRGEAAKVVCFVDGAWDADLVVFRTDVPSDAEWLDGSKADLV